MWRRNGIRIVFAFVFVIASLISICGPLTYLSGDRYSNLFFRTMGILFLPGLTISAVLGGALGLGNLHDPSFIFAGIVNFAIYFFGLFFFLKLILKLKSKTTLPAVEG
jgi:hypothetical protein